MQNNVRQVRASDTLKEAAYELLDRAIDFWTIIDRHKASWPSRWSARTEGEYAARAGGDRGDDRMSRRIDVAKAYEKALFAGNRAETGSYFTDDIVYWWLALPGSAANGAAASGARCPLNREPGLAPPTGDTRTSGAIGTRRRSG